MDTPITPDLPGEWTMQFATGLGAWSLGDLWLDRANRRLAVRVTEPLCNAYGVMQGGAMATLADVQSLAVRSYSGNEAEHTPPYRSRSITLAPHRWAHGSLPM